MNVLDKDYTKLIVIDTGTGEEIAVVTNDLITTANSAIVVKLTPRYDN